MNPQITYFARTEFRGQRKLFGIRQEDRRRHIYIIGKTGVGKTTLITRMISEDIYMGNGLMFVDFHGDAAKAVTRLLRGTGRKAIIFDPAKALRDKTPLVPFNPLKLPEDVGDQTRYLVASNLSEMMKKVWSDSWGPRLEDLLKHCVMALLERPNSTLDNIATMLSDWRFMDSVLKDVHNPDVKEFFDKQFREYGREFKSEVVSPVLNKVRGFTMSKLMRDITCTPKSFNLRRIMDNGDIVVVNLSKGLVGTDNAKLLAAMLVSSCMSNALARAEEEERDRKDFHLYIDEVQNLATMALIDIMPEARKYHLCLTLSHQYLGQMDERIERAILENAGTLITFAVGPETAERLEPYFTPEFNREDLQNLGFAEIYIRLMIDGGTSRPFSARTLPPA